MIDTKPLQTITRHVRKQDGDTSVV
jgi:hypothetical protein